MSDSVKRTNGKFDFVNDPRNWVIVSTEQRCYKLSRIRNQRLIEIVDTETGVLPIVCVFEDYQNE